MDKQRERIPVTLLTGFLGAGKTTLLNHLIRDPNAGRIAVIMNEFGDVGLDHDLIEEVTDDVVLMHAGCLCCSIRGDLAKTMTLLLSRRKRGELSFDRVVIETTGIADPGPILNAMVTDPMIAAGYRADGVVVLADAATGLRTLDTQFEAVQQIAMADLIIVTKTDLVTSEEADGFEKRLEGINGSARRVRVNHGRAPIGELFGLSAMRSSASSQEITGWLGADDPAPLSSASSSLGAERDRSPEPMTATDSGAAAGQKVREHEDGQHEDRHHGIASASIEISEPIPTSVFDFWLDAIMAHKGHDILRLKGIVYFDGMEGPYVFHGVQHIFEAPIPLKSWSGEDTKSRVVVIARDAEKDDLAALLEILRMHPSEPDASLEGAAVGAAGTPI